MFDKEGEIIMAYMLDYTSIPCIVHEAVHMVNFAFHNRGVLLCTNNDEHQAYYTQYIFEKVFNIITKELKDVCE